MEEILARARQVAEEAEIFTTSVMETPMQFEFNPLTSFSPSFLPIEILDIYPDVTWYAPRMRNGQFLCVPIDDGVKPRCVYFVKEISRNCEVVDYSQVF